MLTTFENNTLFIMPLCFHPTTTLLVDDDVDFLAELSDYLSGKISVLNFSDPDEAIEYINSNKPTLFKDRCFYVHGDKETLNIAAIRNEVYNAHRFKEMMTTVIDYNMPNKTGFDLMRLMGLSFGGLKYHSYILLTGMTLSQLDENFASTYEAQHLISKSDPQYPTKLLECIKKNSASSSQWCSFDAARHLALDPLEKANFLFDGNFAPVLNRYIQENKICEFYLFDKQGSFLFLDEDARLSWFFVRSEIGIENSIRRAIEYGAPKAIIDILKSKEVILMLYEKEDFERHEIIDWNQYLLPASIFAGDDAYLDFFQLKPHSNYYYAFTKDFPHHGLDETGILSYRSFLQKG